MKEKEREKKETGKKRSEKKKSQCGNRTRDLLICKHCVAIVSPCMRINDQTSRFYIYNIYIANFDFDDLTVAALAALAPPIKGMQNPKHLEQAVGHCDCGTLHFTYHQSRSEYRNHRNFRWL